MNTALHYGMGLSAGANTAVRVGSTGLGAACGQGTAIAHAAVGTGMQTAAGILLAVPDPTMVTKIAAGVLEIGSAIQNFFFHPDCSKIATTQIVNQAEVFLKQNLAAWQALSPSEKTVEAQQAALMNFDNVWNQVLQACGSGQYGTAGTACIADRQQGACHWQTNGQCWNWFIGYRDPIANDAHTYDDSATASASNLLGSLTSGTGLNPYLLIGGVMLAAAFLVGEA